MAMEKTVVGTNYSFSGIKGCIAEENMIAADRPKEFADQIVRLIKDEARRREIGKKARLLVEKSYIWEETARRMEQMYGRTIEKFHPGFPVCADAHIACFSKTV